jgi:CRISPR-associated protein Cas6/Cse3/CasE subtype I-E
MYISIMNDLKGDDYDVHKAVKEKFGEGRVLFQRRKINTHILSPNPPKGKVVVTKYINGVIGNIQHGDRIDFSLRINPVVSKKTAVGKRGARKAIPAYDVERWMNRKFIQHGFVADFTYEAEWFRESVKEGHVISLNSLMVHGVLEVLNPDSVRQALVQGIGSAKGLGFGMLHIYDTFIIPETI